MLNKVVRLRQRGNAQREELWRSPTPKRLVSNFSSSVVVLFPERSKAAQERSRNLPAPPESLKFLTQLEQENAELRRYVVELALQIQDLKDQRG